MARLSLSHLQGSDIRDLERTLNYTLKQNERYIEASQFDYDIWLISARSLARGAYKKVFTQLEHDRDQMNFMKRHTNRKVRQLGREAEYYFDRAMSEFRKTTIRSERDLRAYINKLRTFYKNLNNWIYDLYEEIFAHEMKEEYKELWKR